MRAGPVRQRGLSTTACCAAAERKPPGRSLERASNDAPRGMAVLDRIRLTGPPAICGPGFREKAGAFIFSSFLRNLSWLGIIEIVGSLRLDGIRFVIYSNDHPPRHVHGFLGETEAIVNLRADGNVALAERRDAVRPADAKRPDVRRILNVAASHFEELAELWRSIHDNS